MLSLIAIGHAEQRQAGELGAAAVELGRAGARALGVDGPERAERPSSAAMRSSAASQTSTADARPAATARRISTAVCGSVIRRAPVVP